MRCSIEVIWLGFQTDSTFASSTAETTLGAKHEISDSEDDDEARQPTPETELPKTEPEVETPGPEPEVETPGPEQEVEPPGPQTKIRRAGSFSEADGGDGRTGAEPPEQEPEVETPETESKLRQEVSDVGGDEIPAAGSSDSGQIINSGSSEKFKKSEAKPWEFLGSRHPA
jgi:hypothetical protein